MNYLDISLLIILGGFVLYGFWFGLIHMIGSLLGIFIGAFAAARFYVAGADWLTFLGNDNLAKVIAFIVIFIVVSKLVGLVFFLIDKAFRFVAVIPFLVTFNRLLGAGLGFVEGVLALGYTIWFIGRFPWSQAFGEVLSSSIIAEILNIVGSILALLAPVALRAVSSVF